MEIVEVHLGKPLADKIEEAEDERWGIEEAFEVERMELMDCFHVAVVAGMRIVKVICTFAFDLGDDREYSDRSVDTRREHMDRLEWEFEPFVGFEGAGKVEGDFVVGHLGVAQEAAAGELVAVAIHLSYRLMT